MKSIALNAFPRSVLKRSGVKKLRSTGRVPAVIYGQKEPKNLEINTKEIENVIKAAHSEILLLDLSLNGSNAPRFTRSERRPKGHGKRAGRTRW
jgi:ribosomal protein L25 (general stress protein Ctc)